MGAQDSVILYFNKDRIKVPDKAMADFYVKGFPDGNGNWKGVEYNSNHQISMTGTFLSKDLKIRHGKFISYSKTGKKESEGNYVNNLMEEKWTYWHENGEKKSEGNWHNGLQDGTWIYWHDNGLKKAEGTYTAGKSAELWRYWHENGSKQSEGRMLNGIKTGVWKFWNEKKGYLETEEAYQYGKPMVITSYYENGSKRLQGQIINHKRSGEWTFWNIDGRMYFRGNYLNGEQQGIWTRYFANGETMQVDYEKGATKDPTFGRILTFD